MKRKQRGLVVNVVVYTIAFIIGIIASLFSSDILLSSFIFTMVATLPVFIVSHILQDTSLYDPYWSVEPPVLLFLNMIRFSCWNINAILLFFVFFIWAARLTINWYVTYKGAGKEDWRYHDFRKKLPAPLFFLLNLFGFQYMPTIVVYLGMVPGLILMQEPRFHPFTILGYLIMLAGVLLEYLADTTVHTFIKNLKGQRKTCDIGIWKYSRHPNYLGELTFWFGLLVAYFLVLPNAWYYGIGSIAIDLVFICASIPLMENHNKKRRPDYPDYQKRTSVLFLWPPKS
ncbi:MAG: DUF1295 domain-containing protein [Firmicutes bacterium]|nr:DUF1295 domain-containing protein [Bacillota bacterium]